MVSKASTALLVLGGLALLVGLGTLLRPYTAPMDLPDDQGSIGVLQLVVPCKAPLIDAVTADSDGWINYAPDGLEPAGSPTGRADGPMCTPESTRRLLFGGALIAVGVLLLGAGSAWWRAARRAPTAHEPAPPAADPPVSSAPAP